MLTTPIFSDAHHRIISLTLLLTFVLAAATPVLADEVTASQATATEDSATEDTNAAVAAEQTTATATDDTDGATEKHLIRFQFQQDATLRYDSRQAVRQVANTPKGVKTDVSKVDQVRVFTVNKVSAEGDAELRMQFASVHMQLQPNGDTPVVFHNKMKPAEVPPIFRSAADKLRGAAPVYQVRPSGAPVDDEGKLVVDSAGQASFVFPLPQNAVAVGESWKVQIPVRVRVAEGVMRTVHLLRTYRLKQVSDGTATITFATSIDRSVKNAAIKGQLIQSTPQGTITFDLDRGCVLKRVLKFNNTVINAFGARTMLSATGQTVETLLEEDAKVTAR